MSKYSFTSESKGLVLQDAVKPEDGTGVWARFEGGVFETDDAKVAARLRKVDGVEETSEVEPELPTTPLVEVLPDPRAAKGAWVDYAAAHGMTREQAQARTKDELVEHFVVLRPATQDSPEQHIVPEAQPHPTALNPDTAD